MTNNHPHTHTPIPRRLTIDVIDCARAYVAAYPTTSLTELAKALASWMEGQLKGQLEGAAGEEEKPHDGKAVSHASAEASDEDIEMAGYILFNIADDVRHGQLLAKHAPAKARQEFAARGLKVVRG